MRFDLVFEGGGAKGMVFVGALQEFIAQGHNLGRLLGTSAGAITATFLAAGYTPSEMLEALAEKDETGRPVFAAFLGRPRPLTPEEAAASMTKATLDKIDFTFLPEIVEHQFDRLVLSLMGKDAFAHFFSFIERGGWFSADAFTNWLQRKLDQGNAFGRARRFSEMTLLDYYFATGTDLSLIAADTTDRRMLVLNHITAPLCPVVAAVRMSMSLPFVWQEVVWQQEWGLYLGISLTGHRIVDGGLLSNFPIELFISRDPHVTGIMGPTTSAGVLGMLIDESLPVHNAPAEVHSADGLDLGALAVPGRIRDLVDTATQAHDKMIIDSFRDYVCRLPAKGYRTTEFDMTDQRREALVRAGREAMRRYFTRAAQQAAGREGLDSERVPAETPQETADRLARNILGP
jgi:predicted acylesterase/phospholipase RssA